MSGRLAIGGWKRSTSFSRAAANCSFVRRPRLKSRWKMEKERRKLLSLSNWSFVILFLHLQQVVWRCVPRFDIAAVAAVFSLRASCEGRTTHWTDFFRCPPRQVPIIMPPGKATLIGTEELLTMVRPLSQRSAALLALRTLCGCLGSQVLHIQRCFGDEVIP